ncbi:MAG: hypothetical protein ACLPID_13750 [Beijerinckiaceae bacterium]
MTRIKLQGKRIPGVDFREAKASLIKQGAEIVFAQTESGGAWVNAILEIEATDNIIQRIRLMAHLNLLGGLAEPEQSLPN